MAIDIEDRLYSIIRNTEWSLQRDKSTLPGNEALLLAYVRFVCDGVIHEELGMVLSLDIDTRGNFQFCTYRIVIYIFSTDQKSKFFFLCS